MPYLTEYIYVLPFQYETNVKISTYFTFFCFILSVCDLCVFYTYSTSQFGLATFHTFQRHLWLVAAKLNSLHGMPNLPSLVISFTSHCCGWIHFSYFSFITLDSLSHFPKSFSSFSHTLPTGLHCLSSAILRSST